MRTVLTRDEILAVDDRVIEWVPVPEWSPDLKEGEEPKGVFIQGLSGTDRDSFEVGMVDQRRNAKGKMTQEMNLRNLRAKLIARTAVDSEDVETAKQIFTLQDVEALGRKSAQALQRLYAVAQRLSGLSNEDVEEMTAELGEGQSDASGTASLLPSGIEASPNVNDRSAHESSPNGEPSTPLSLSGIDA